MWSVTAEQLKAQEHQVWDTVSTGSLVAVKREGVHRVLLLRTYVPTADWVDWRTFVGSSFDAVYDRVARGDRLRTTRDDGVTIYVVPIGVFAPVGLSQDGIEKWLVAAEDEFLIGPILVRDQYEPPKAPGEIGTIYLRFSP
jgi:hypothetical protein